MRVTRLSLTDVRRHRHLELHPAPGLTVIRGPNESGKSTIQVALEMALFRRATSVGQETQDVRTWESGADPRIELDFEHEGKTGRLVKVFGGQRGTVSLDMDGETDTDPARVDTILAELTGLPSERFFRSTASVRHHELADLDRDEGALRDRLQLSMSGADRGTWTARRKLDEAIKRLRSEGPKYPGPLKATRDELARSRTDLASGEESLRTLEADRAAFANANDRCAALDAEADRDATALATAEVAVKLAAAGAEAQERYERLRRATDIDKRIRTAEHSHPSAVALAELAGGMEQAKNLQFHIEEIESQLESEPDLSAFVVEAARSRRWKPWALLAVLLTAGAIGAAAAGALAAGIGTTGYAAAGVLGLLALLALGMIVRARRSGRRIRSDNELREGEIARRLRGRSDDEDRLRAARRDRDALLTRLGVADLSAGTGLLEAETAHVASIDRLRAELRGLLGDAPRTEELTSQRDRAAAEADQARHALAGMGEVGADPERARLAAQEAVRATQRRRDQARDERGEARGRVDSNAVDAEQVASLAESVLDAEERLAALERRVRLYETTLAAIGDAEQATMKKAARYLEERMGRDLATITGGRYARIQVDEAALSFTVWSVEKEAWVGLRDLSRGTVDQLYLAARLGLVRQVTQERTPPLIFDDPFVTFDDERARRAVELLRRLAADHQVLYLTTSARYDDMADAVIELPAPTARDVVVSDPVEDAPALEEESLEANPLAGSPA